MKKNNDYEAGGAVPKLLKGTEVVKLNQIIKEKLTKLGIMNREGRITVRKTSWQGRKK